jgi:hypothetical protein
MDESDSNADLSKQAHEFYGTIAKPAIDCVLKKS